MFLAHHLQGTVQIPHQGNLFLSLHDWVATSSAALLPSPPTCYVLGYSAKVPDTPCSVLPLGHPSLLQCHPPSSLSQSLPVSQTYLRWFFLQEAFQGPRILLFSVCQNAMVVSNRTICLRVCGLLEDRNWDLLTSIPCPMPDADWPLSKHVLLWVGGKMNEESKVIRRGSDSIGQL